MPLVPAALERIDVGKTLVDQLLCPRALVNSSGQAQYKTRMVSLGYLAAKLSTASGSTRMAPLIFSTGLPVLPKPHVYNDHIWTAELGTELFLGHFRDCALDHRRLEQQACKCNSP